MSACGGERTCQSTRTRAASKGVNSNTQVLFRKQLAEMVVEQEKGYSETVEIMWGLRWQDGKKFQQQYQRVRRAVEQFNAEKFDFSEPVMGKALKKRAVRAPGAGRKEEIPELAVRLYNWWIEAYVFLKGSLTTKVLRLAAQNILKDLQNEGCDKSIDLKGK